MNSIRTGAALAVVLTLGLASPVAAQTVTLEQYRPAPTPDDGFALERPTAPGHLRPSFSAHLSYAREPLSFVPDARPSDRVAVVENQLSLSVLASLGLFERFLAYVRLPAVLMMEGTSIAGAPQADGAGLGDLTLGARYVLHEQPDELFRLAVSLAASVPTARLANDASDLTGEPGVSFWPQLVGEVRPAREVNITASVGGRFREDAQAPLLDVGHELTWGLGVGVEVVPQYLDLRLETFSSVSLSRFGDSGTTPWEVLLGARTRPIAGLQLGLAGGLGVTNGYGNPTFRGVFTIGWIGEGEPVAAGSDEAAGERDREALAGTTGDGAGAGGATDTPGAGTGATEAPGADATVADATPTSEQPRLAQIPAAIARQAGRTATAAGVEVPREERAAPQLPSDPRYRTQDRDGDRVVDALDRCPIDAEDYDEIDDEDGCPEEDADDDGLADADDHCPLTAGSATNDACAGCPSRACMAVGGTIDIGEQVRFALGTDEIREESVPLLSDVQSILATNPRIRRVRIEGHTDNVGDSAANRQLSLARARAIVTWLVSHGIDAQRLEGWGCGQDQPIASNEHASGRSLNRRVEFIIVEPSSGRTLRVGCDRVGN